MQLASLVFAYIAVKMPLEQARSCDVRTSLGVLKLGNFVLWKLNLARSLYHLSQRSASYTHDGESSLPKMNAVPPLISVWKRRLGPAARPNRMGANEASCADWLPAG